MKEAEVSLSLYTMQIDFVNYVTTFRNEEAMNIFTLTTIIYLHYNE